MLDLILTNSYGTLTNFFISYGGLAISYGGLTNTYLSLVNMFFEDVIRACTYAETTWYILLLAAEDQESYDE